MVDMVPPLSMFPRLTMDMDTILSHTLTDTTLVMARDPLMLSLVMLQATLTEALKVCLAMADTVMADMAMVDMDMVVMVMVDITARDLLMLDTMEDTMVVLAPLFIRADPTTTDLTVMALTTMARGPLMLDTMDMETMV